MALLFMDSFDHYATADLAEKWLPVGTYGTISIASGGRTSNCIKRVYASSRNSPSAGVSIAPYRPASTSSGIVGFAVKTATWSSQQDVNSFLVSVWEGSTLHLGLYVEDDATISVYRGSTANQVGQSAGGLVDGQWNYIEWAWEINDTTGTTEVRLNGTPILTATGKDTRNGGASGVWTSVRLWGHDWIPTSPTDTYIDDLYLLDKTTGTYRSNNDFWGDTSIKYLVPNGDVGGQIQWDRTGSGLTYNYDAVKETSPDDDTTYVSTDVVDERDLYDFPSVTAGATIYGVQAVISAKKGDTGSAQIAAVCKSDTVEEEHPYPLGIASDSAYNFYLFPWNGDPKDQTTWTESRLNAAQFGPKKTA